MAGRVRQRSGGGRRRQGGAWEACGASDGGWVPRAPPRQAAPCASPMPTSPPASPTPTRPLPPRPAPLPRLPPARASPLRPLAPHRACPPSPRAPPLTAEPAPAPPPPCPPHTAPIAPHRHLRLDIGPRRDEPVHHRQVAVLRRDVEGRATVLRQERRCGSAALTRRKTQRTRTRRGWAGRMGGARWWQGRGAGGAPGGWAAAVRDGCGPGWKRGGRGRVEETSPSSHP